MLAAKASAKGTTLKAEASQETAESNIIFKVKRLKTLEAARQHKFQKSPIFPENIVKQEPAAAKTTNPEDVIEKNFIRFISRHATYYTCLQCFTTLYPLSEAC